MKKRIINLGKKILPRFVKTKLSKVIPTHFFLIPYKEKSINILHDKKIIFIHNPKCAGTSIKRILGIEQKGADHRTPGDLVSSKTWEDYFSFTVIRHPLDRFVSSYFYRTSPKYHGSGYYKNFSMEKYFDIMITEKLPIHHTNTEYVHHKYAKTKKNIDFICRFENLERDLEKLCKIIDIPFRYIHENKISHHDYRQYFEKNERLRNKCMNYYEVDFKTFGYRY